MSKQLMYSVNLTQDEALLVRCALHQYTEVQRKNASGMAQIKSIEDKLQAEQIRLDARKHFGYDR